MFHNHTLYLHKWNQYFRLSEFLTNVFHKYTYKECEVFLTELFDSKAYF